ncbi:MAG: LysM peptidoglycan-binding domain-containing protein [Candidatus Dormibacteria bacterium]
MGTDVLSAGRWPATPVHPRAGRPVTAVIVDGQPARRIPRRRRWPVGRTILVSALVACFGWGLLGGAGAGSAPTAAVTVVVRPGDTVWSIASRHAGGGDIRTEVAQILSRNGLSSPVIQPGETLVVPAG